MQILLSLESPAFQLIAGPASVTVNPKCDS